MCDISYALILDLDDAGLIDSNANIGFTVSETKRGLFYYGDHVLRLEPPTGFNVNMFRLTTPGSELAKVAHVVRSPEYFFATAHWLIEGYYLITSRWAQLPASGRSGNMEQLQWKPIPEEAPDSTIMSK
jgi:hypothetical protein